MKGYVQTLEAVIALGIILLSITIVLTPQTYPEKVDLKDNYYNFLDHIDNKGLLRSYVENNMEAELSDELEDCLPKIASFSVKICSTSNCIASLPEDKTIESYNYFVAGYKTPNPKLIKIWLWI